MECKNRHVIGRSIVLERQERYSFETNERIYLHRHYHNPTFDAARTSSSSDDIEKIHRTRERVEGLSNQINFEIERLKEFNNSLKKDERLMTWDERFRANPPLTKVLNKKHGPGRSDDVSKEVKQKDGSPRKPPPKGISLYRPPPLGEPSPQEFPYEFTPNELPPKMPLPKELSKEIPQNITPPMRLPLKELPRKELTYLLLPKEEIPPNRLPLEELDPKKLPPRALPAKETPSKGLALKEVNPRKPMTGALPRKELPPKGPPPKTILSKGVLPKTLPPKGLPSKGVPSKTTPPKGLALKSIPPKGLPPKNIPPKGAPPRNTTPKGLLPKTIPPKGVPPKNIHPRWVPLKTTPPKGVQPKTIPSKGILPKSILPKGVPPKGVPPKTIPPKGVPSKTIPPKDLPAKDLPAKRLPLIELPPKKTPPKPPMTRKAPPKLSTQKELKPEKPPPKDVAPKNPIPKEEPMQGLGELRSLGDGTPEELAARISGGCFNCYCQCDQCCCPTFEGSCYIEPDCNCDMGFDQGIQYGIPYCTARRRVTDLNTQEMCSNRFVGVSPDRKSSKQCSSIRDKAKDKKKSPIRCGRTSPVNNMKNQEKVPKVEHCEKVQKVSNLGKRPENKINEKPQLKKNYQPPVNIKQEKSKAPKEDVTKLDVAPIASPTKDQKIYVDERMYEDYLSLYYKENSKTDLLETTPTYTRLPDKSSAKPLRSDTDRTIGHRNSIEGQKVSNCFTEMYPGPFRYEECFEEQDYTSPDNNRTEPVSDSHSTTPKDCRCPQPTESCAYSQHPKSTRSQDKDRQEMRPESVMTRTSERSPWKTDSTRYVSSWKTDSTRYVSLPVKRHSGTPSTRQASATTETQRSKERSSLTYPLDSSEKSTQVYNDRHSNLSSGPPSTRRAHSPTTDSRRQSGSSPISFREGSPRKAQSPPTDSRRQSDSSPISFREGSPRKIQSPSTDSRRQSDSSPISFREGSSQMPQSPTTDSRRQSPISFREGSSQMAQSPTTISNGANSSRIAPSQTPDSTRDTTVMNPHYQPEDIDRKYRADESSDEGPEYDSIDMDVQIKHPIESTDFEDAFSTLSGKTVRSSKEFQDFQDSEMSEAEEAFPSSRRHSSQSKARNVDQEEDPKHKYYSARSIDSSKRASDESQPIVRTLCEKRTRTVTFKDEQGDLKKQRQVEEECRSHIDWEPALNYPQYDSTLPNDNYTSRSSSSAEHTCLESSCDDEEDAYDSCFESPCGREEQRHSFKACPCMYETYRQLADLCQTKSPYYR